MLLNEKLKIFSEELKLVKTFSIKKFVIECLDEAPDYVFINCPSSSTGKYHALDEFSPMGNVLHTQRVVSNCNEMARAFSLEGKDQYGIWANGALVETTSHKVMKVSKMEKVV